MLRLPFQKLVKPLGEVVVTAIVQIGICFMISDAPRGANDIVYNFHTLLWN